MWESRGFTPGNLPFAFVDTDADKKFRVIFNPPADSMHNRKGPRTEVVPKLESGMVDAPGPPEVIPTLSELQPIDGKLPMGFRHYALSFGGRVLFFCVDDLSASDGVANF